MNTYFNKNQSFHSNKRIIEGFYTETKSTVSPLRIFADKLLKLLFLLFRFLTGIRTKKFVKTAVFTIGFISFVGVIGAMEQGSLSIWSGLVLALIIAGIEYLCLRRNQRD